MDIDVDREIPTSSTTRVQLRLATARDLRKARFHLISGARPQPPDRNKLLPEICALLQAMKSGETAGGVVGRLSREVAS